MNDLFLIVKRGLYYRPNSKGYTGLKEDAGRYSLEDVALRFPNMDSPNQDGMEFISEADAPDYSPACPWDVKMKREASREGYRLGMARAAEIAEMSGVVRMPQDGSYSHHEPVMGPDIAAKILGEIDQ